MDHCHSSMNAARSYLVNTSRALLLAQVLTSSVGLILVPNDTIRDREHTIQDASECSEGMWRQRGGESSTGYS